MRPFAEAAVISPSAATATALSGAGRVVTIGVAGSVNGQIRTVAS
jgi:hypothetical protein